MVALCGRLSYRDTQADSPTILIILCYPNEQTSSDDSYSNAVWLELATSEFALSFFPRARGVLGYVGAW